MAGVPRGRPGDRVAARVGGGGPGGRAGSRSWSARAVRITGGGCRVDYRPDRQQAAPPTDGASEGGGCRRRRRRLRTGRPAPVRPPRPRRVTVLRLGSRGSRLALTQAALAAERLRAPGREIALVPITTAGDRDRRSPFGEIGDRGVFVKELEEALLDGRIDAAVHSAKDMTSTDTAGLAVGAYLVREDARDALCGAAAIRPGMRVGTASARRRGRLPALEPTLPIERLRGTIDTRRRKRAGRGRAAVVPAAGGLDRLGLAAETDTGSIRPSCYPRPGRGRWPSRSAPERRRW